MLTITFAEYLKSFKLNMLNSEIISLFLAEIYENRSNDILSSGAVYGFTPEQ
jgi:hypothetical protein